jgi:HK97 family phage prohead protease
MLQTKEISENTVLDVDTEKRTVKAVWANIGNIDLDNDVIEFGAFTKTIAERGPSGKNMIWSLIDHKTSIMATIGKPQELYVQGTQLIAITKIVDTEAGEAAICLYNESLINQHSIGYGVPKGKSEIKNGVRYIKEVMLYEGSAVLWGVNPETPTLGLFKGFNMDNENDPIKRLDMLNVLLKKGKLTDDTLSLIEIEIKAIQTQIISTKAAENAPLPQAKNSIVDAIKLFNALN